jgi:hypothetical protein
MNMFDPSHKKYGFTVPSHQLPKTIDIPPEDVKDLGRGFEAPQEKNFIKEQFDRMKLGEPERASVNDAHSKIDEMGKMLHTITDKMGPAMEETKLNFEDIKKNFGQIDAYLALVRKRSDDLENRMAHLENKIKNFLTKNSPGANTPRKTKHDAEQGVAE